MSHIFVGSKAQWHEINDDLPQFEERYPDTWEPPSKAPSHKRMQSDQSDRRALILTADAERYALRNRRIDGENIFLIGHSEGAIIAATFNDPESPVNARIVESWTCNASWSEYGGINAPIDEPVLTLLAENNPWFNKPWNTGSCERYIDTTNGSKSIVFRQTGIRDRHGLLELEIVQEIVLEFLTHHRK